MNWIPTGLNPQVVEAFNDYRSFVLRIATLYAGARLIEAVDLSAFADSFKLAISDDFPEGATTIRTVGDLKLSIQSKEYGQLALALSTIQLCTAFEILFERVSEIYGVEVNKSDRFDISHTPVAGGPVVMVTLGNRSLMQIRKLHQTLNVSSPLNRDETLLKLAAYCDAASRCLRIARYEPITLGTPVPCSRLCSAHKTDKGWEIEKFWRDIATVYWWSLVVVDILVNLVSGPTGSPANRCLSAPWRDGALAPPNMRRRRPHCCRNSSTRRPRSRASEIAR